MRVISLLLYVNELQVVIISKGKVAPYKIQGTNTTFLKSVQFKR
ncbi:hypothetical protein JCM19297_954 [Nonlabens ulvanivorans]|nr:hypothetical protein JCM19297_954 [Nonlabens ulvanivorans]